jgi:hypothetical protein
MDVIATSFEIRVAYEVRVPMKALNTFARI